MSAKEEAISDQFAMQRQVRFFVRQVHAYLS